MGNRCSFAYKHPHKIKASNIFAKEGKINIASKLFSQDKKNIEASKVNHQN